MTLLRDDAVQSMPPFAMWIQGAADIGRWMVEPGPSECRGSRLLADLRQRLPGVRAVPARPDGRVCAVGACRCSRSQEGRSPGCTSSWPSSTPSGSSPRSASRSTSTPRPASSSSARSAGRDVGEDDAAPRGVGQQRQTGHVVHGAEVGRARALRVAWQASAAPSGPTTVTRHQVESITERTGDGSGHLIGRAIADR